MAKKKFLAANQNHTQKQEEQYAKNKMILKEVLPMTDKQKRLKQIYTNPYYDCVVSIGSAGTGKTWYTLSMALEDVVETGNYDNIIIVRTAVQSRDQGFLPGKLSDKMLEYETPYIDIVNDLYQRNDAYKILKDRGNIKFMSSSFIRGLTFNNSVIIFDECQNATYHELRSLATRVGENSRLVLCGDTKQDDLKISKNKNDTSGLAKFMKVLDKMENVGVVNFTKEDIVRSGFVKKFIITEEEMENDLRD